MEISAVLLARVVAFVETSDLNPRGAAFSPSLVPLLVERFQFQRYPQKPEDFDEQKGVVFEMGYTGKTTIDKITVWANGIGLDVRSSTSDAKDILDSALRWLKEKGGLAYNPAMISRWAYLSQLTLFSEIDLDAIHPAFSKLNKSLHDALAAAAGVKVEFRTVGLTFNFDRSLLASPIATFTVQRRLDTPFEQMKFFSEAPLPTETHIALLGQLEADLRGGG